MPRPSTSTLKMPSVVEVVLVPLDDGAVVHRGVLDRHQLVEARARDHEAADMLREMAREADELVGRARCALREPRIGRIEPDRAAPPFRVTPCIDQPHSVPASASIVSQRQAERLADVADGAAAAIGDHGRGQAGALAAVLS